MTFSDALDVIRKTYSAKTGKPSLQLDLGIVLGSGLGQFGEKLVDPVEIPYDRIPGFKPCGVEGHAGQLLIGTIEGKTVICQQGRYHFYEGHAMEDVVFPMRVMAKLGVEKVLITNAAGGINTSFQAGDIMLIEDHINYMGTNPLIGPNKKEFGPRFPDMSYAYCPEQRANLLRCAEELNIPVRKGVYLAVSGPSYETPAEIRMFRSLGADVVGMSTVPETIVANHSGMKVLGLSCISNPAAGISSEKLSHDEVKEVIGKMSEKFEELVRKWIKTQ